MDYFAPNSQRQIDTTVCYHEMIIIVESFQIQIVFANRGEVDKWSRTKNTIFQNNNWQINQMFHNF